MMPEPTAQYVHVLRVWVVPASLKGRIEDANTDSTSPKPSAPSVVPARLALAPCIKPRRNPSIFIGRSSWSFIPPIGGALFGQAHCLSCQWNSATAKRYFGTVPKSISRHSATSDRSGRKANKRDVESIRHRLLHCSTAISASDDALV